MLFYLQSLHHLSFLVVLSQPENPKDQVTPTKAIYWSFYHVARYDPLSENTENRNIIFGDKVGTEPSGSSPWYDGFANQMSGIASHHGDFKTVDFSSHGDRWVLSSSTHYTYSSNFEKRILLNAEITEESRNRVYLQIIPFLDTAYHLAEVLVISTPFALTPEENEDIERVLILRNLPLCMREHYTTDGWNENDGDTETWDDSSFSQSHANIEGSGLVLQDRDEDGFVLETGGSSTTIEFGDFLLPPYPFTMFSVLGKVTVGDVGVEYNIPTIPLFQDCMQSTLRADTEYSIAACNGKGNPFTSLAK
jgi:hypothetical protein